MSYQITIVGQVDTTDTTTAEAEEASIVASVDELLKTLGTAAGVTAAQGAFQFVGTVDFLAAPPAPTPVDELNTGVNELSNALAGIDPTTPGYAALLKAAQDIDAAAAAITAAPAPTTATGQAVANVDPSLAVAEHPDITAAKTAPAAL